MTAIKTKRASPVIDPLSMVRRRVAVLTGVLLNDGISARAYRQLQILHGELGQMPSLQTEERGGFVYMKGDEEC